VVKSQTMSVWFTWYIPNTSHMTDIQ
jgi:hypothetical protein